MLIKIIIENALTKVESILSHLNLMIPSFDFQLRPFLNIVHHAADREEKGHSLALHIDF